MVPFRIRLSHLAAKTAGDESGDEAGDETEDDDVKWMLQDFRGDFVRLMQSVWTAQATALSKASWMRDIEPELGASSQ